MYVYSFDQAKYIYKEIEKVSCFNIQAIKQELENGRSDKENEEENPYQTMIINDFEKFMLTHMEQW